METITQPATSTQPRSRTRRALARFAVGLAAVLLIAYLGISALAANILTTPRRVLGGRTPAALNLAFDDVSFPARGGDVRIAGWFIPQQSSRAIVLVHGKDSSRADEFQGHFVDLAAALHARGFAVLMIDMRGHGRSGDAHFSFGLDERRDVEGAVDWLKTQGFRPGSIGVLGVSMGAASSIGAVADDPDIGALVEDSSYAAIYPIIQEQWRGASGLPEFFLPSTLLIGQLLFGHDIIAANPVDEVGRIAPRPLLIVHGTADRLIPIAHAEQLKAAAPAAELWVVAGAGHAGSYRADPQAYVAKVVGFFEKSLR
jgi:pimeloyl-ACP methyl ester carboxylesterase